MASKHRRLGKKRAAARLGAWTLLAAACAAPAAAWSQGLRLSKDDLQKRANGVLFISGDIHYAELSKLDVNVPYPLWDLTSSGLTEEWRILTPNANRASEVVADANFGWIDIDWRGSATVLSLGITDATGRERLRWTLPLAELAVPA